MYVTEIWGYFPRIIPYLLSCQTLTQLPPTPITNDHSSRWPLPLWHNIKSSAVQMATRKKIMVEVQPSWLQFKQFRNPLELVINPFGLVSEQMWQVELFPSLPWSFAELSVHMVSDASNSDCKCFWKFTLQMSLVLAMKVSVVLWGFLVNFRVVLFMYEPTSY